jgi:hypothetical protein
LTKTLKRTMENPSAMSGSGRIRRWNKRTSLRKFRLGVSRKISSPSIIFIGCKEDRVASRVPVQTSNIPRIPTRLSTKRRRAPIKVATKPTSLEKPGDLPRTRETRRLIQMVTRWKTKEQTKSQTGLSKPLERTKRRKRTVRQAGSLLTSRMVY